MASVASSTEITKHVYSIIEAFQAVKQDFGRLQGGQTPLMIIPQDAAEHFIAMAQAGRDVYGYSNPWHHNLWLEDTRLEAADIRNLWPIHTMENGRPYLIPPQAFIAWLRSERGTPSHALLGAQHWTTRDLASMFLQKHRKGFWKFIGQVAFDPNSNPRRDIHLTPFEFAFIGDALYTAHEAATYAEHLLEQLARQGFVE